MLSIIKIPFLLCLGVAAFYPLFIWVDQAKHLEQSFYRFHTIFPSILIFLSFFLDKIFSLFSLFYMGLWLYQMIIVSTLSWKKKFVNPWIISLPSLWGIYVLCLVHWKFFDAHFFDQISLILNVIVFVSSYYAAILGHWYLNMKGLSLSFLKKAVIFYFSFTLMRSFLSLYMLLTKKFSYHSEMYRVFEFVQHFEGFFLLVSFFLSIVVLPLLGWMILKVTYHKNTQSVTGLLYVNCALLIMVEFFFKYYIFRYRLIL